eukprot:SAG11_NODE_4399_length_1912_cov_1.757860_3_plen_115_part_00
MGRRWWHLAGVGRVELRSVRWVRVRDEGPCTTSPTHAALALLERRRPDRGVEHVDRAAAVGRRLGAASTTAVSGWASGFPRDSQQRSTSAPTTQQRSAGAPATQQRFGGVPTAQ